jgi:hypothetical protein
VKRTYKKESTGRNFIAYENSRKVDSSDSGRNSKHQKTKQKNKMGLVNE